MVLESLITARLAKKNPAFTFLYSFIYMNIAFVIAWLVFPADPSWPAIFLMTMMFVPFLVNLLKGAELYAETEIQVKQIFMMKKHKKLFLIFFYLFMGALTATTLWASLSPSSVYSKLFERQIRTIQSISSSFLKARVTGANGFTAIVVNNFKVLVFVLLFSFLFGAGAIYILSWNASVVGVAIGNLIREYFSAFAQGSWKSYLHVVPLSFARYMTHGVIEVAAYFLAAIAGGIISAAVIRKSLADEEFFGILRSSFDLILTASILLILAGIVEVTVSPHILA